MCVCLCLNVGLTASRINLIFGIHTHIGSDCAIGYMILTFEVIKGHFWSNKVFCQVPLGFLLSSGPTCPRLLLRGGPTWQVHSLGNTYARYL